MAKRSRITVGRLVASTNPLRKIFARRLNVEVTYCKSGFTNRIISERVVGIAVSTN